MLGLLYLFFFFLDWFCTFLFRIDFGLFFTDRLALLHIFFLKILVQIFFWLKVEQINFFFI